MYDRHKTVVAREERAGYGVEKSSSTEALFVVLKASALSESKTASDVRFMPASEGETLLLQVADEALFETYGSQ